MGAGLLNANTIEDTTYGNEPGIEHSNSFWLKKKTSFDMGKAPVFNEFNKL